MSDPSPRRRDAGRPRGASVVDAVLRCTLEELATHGVANLSVDRVARAAEVNRSSVYRRWPTREALVQAALERVAADVEGHVGDRGSLRADLLALVEQVAGVLATPAGRALVQAAVAEEGAVRGPDGLPPLVERLRVEPSVMERARARGEWRDDARPDVALAMLVGALLHRALLERAPLDEAWMRDVVELVVRAVRP